MGSQDCSPNSTQQEWALWEFKTEKPESLLRGRCQQGSGYGGEGVLCGWWSPEQLAQSSLPRGGAKETI